VELTVLSNLIGFEIRDRNGVALGRIADFVVNTCETYLIYFLLERSENTEQADRVFVPYEAVTINSGILDAEAGAIVLYLTEAHLNGAPAYPVGMSLTSSGWEDEVRAFWSQYIRISNLTTECLVTTSAGERVAVREPESIGEDRRSHLVARKWKDWLFRHRG
jgi:sporulation protein YlmC with PRC-barrel domain